MLARKCHHSYRLRLLIADFMAFSVVRGMSQTIRRQFVLSAGILLTLPRIACAQSRSKVQRVAYLAYGAPQPLFEAFTDAMRKLGYDVGKSLVIEWHAAEGQVDRLDGLAANLVKREVDVIVCADTPSVRATKQATSTIPIVMATVGDPVASGFIASLARPGGNITGLSLANAEIAAKWFEMALLVSPRSQIGVLANPDQPTAQSHLMTVLGAAQKQGRKAPVAYAAKPADFERAFVSLINEKVSTVIVLPSGLFVSRANATLIAQTALTYRIALIATERGFVERGALLGYGQDYAAFNRRAATYVDKILKGASPSELPVEQPTILQLTVNRATAKQLGLTIPKERLLRADEVIE